jgi:pimeloyl-ACP methyl ester carboxylesterase
MPYLLVDDAELFYRAHGDGEALVLVHGSWADHTEWESLAAPLGEHHRVVRYDRRGHSRSGRGLGSRVRRQDEDDLAAIVERLDCAPAHVVGNSLGGSIALALTARRPELVRSVCVHEPPLLGPTRDDPHVRPLVDEVRDRTGEVIRLLREGDLEGGARRFVERVALGPGAWDALPPEVRELLVRNARTFLDDLGDQGWSELALPGAGGLGRPVLITRGTESPAWLRAVAASLAERIPGARGRVLEGAGHLPHATDPPGYAAAVDELIRTARPLAGAS